MPGDPKMPLPEENNNEKEGQFYKDEAEVMGVKIEVFYDKEKGTYLIYTPQVIPNQELGPMSQVVEVGNDEEKAKLAFNHAVSRLNEKIGDESLVNPILNESGVEDFGKLHSNLSSLHREVRDFVDNFDSNNEE